MQPTEADREKARELAGTGNAVGPGCGLTKDCTSHGDECGWCQATAQALCDERAAAWKAGQEKRHDAMIAMVEVSRAAMADDRRIETVLRNLSNALVKLPIEPLPVEPEPAAKGEG